MSLLALRDKELELVEETFEFEIGDLDGPEEEELNSEENEAALAKARAATAKLIVDRPPRPPPTELTPPSSLRKLTLSELSADECPSTPPSTVRPIYDLLLPPDDDDLSEDGQHAKQQLQGVVLGYAAHHGRWWIPPEIRDNIEHYRANNVIAIPNMGADAIRLSINCLKNFG